MPRKTVDYPQPELGQALQFVRKAKGLTQSDLSRRSTAEDTKPLNSTYVSHLERPSEKNITPTPGTLQRILDALDLPEPLLRELVNGRIWDEPDKRDDAMARLYQHWSRHTESGEVSRLGSATMRPDKADLVEDRSVADRGIRPRMQRRGALVSEPMRVVNAPASSTPDPSVLDAAFEELRTLWPELSKADRATLLGIARQRVCQ